MKTALDFYIQTQKRENIYNFLRVKTVLALIEKQIADGGYNSHFKTKQRLNEQELSAFVQFLRVLGFRVTVCCSLFDVVTKINDYEIIVDWSFNEKADDNLIEQLKNSGSVFYAA